MAVTATTWNPSDKDSGGGTLSGGNLTYDGGTGGVRSTFGATTGKYYWEVIYPTGVSNQAVGVATSASNLDTYPGGDPYAWAMDSASGGVYSNTVNIANSTSGAVVTVLSILLDATAKELRYWVDGGDCGIVIPLTGSQFFAVVGYTGQTATNFGASSFTYTPPVGYEAGLGSPAPANQTAYPQGNSGFAFGYPSAVYGPNRTAQVIGAGLFSSGTARAIASEDVTVYPQGSSIFAFGTPAVIRGPNRTAQAVGGIAFSSGVHHAQLGYPASVVPEGVSVFSAGTPEALPYAAKILPVPGYSVFGAGRPMAIADPIATLNKTVAAVGVSVFSSGAPTSASSGTVQVAGSSVFSSGTATASQIVHVTGTSVFKPGAPIAGLTVKPVSSSVFSAGTPSAGTLAFPVGASVFHAGTSIASAAGVVTAAGVSTFRAGTPSTSACVHARGASVFRSGRPTIDRGATC